MDCTNMPQPNAEQLQQLNEALENLVDATEAIKPIIECVCKQTKELWDKLMEAAARDINPKWWHYYKHSKRKRIRKKYQTRIQNHLMEMLAEGGQP